MADHRIQLLSGERVNFSCENRGYKTDIDRRGSFPHEPSYTLGSVINGPLAARGESVRESDFGERSSCAGSEAS